MSGISVIMPIDWHRLVLFHRTLEQYVKLGIPDDVEFVFPTRTISASDIPKSLQPVDFKVVPYSYQGVRFSPVLPLDIGIANAKHESVIITSPEVLPLTDVLHQLQPYKGQNVVCKAFDEDEKGNRDLVLVSTTFRHETPAMYFLAMYSKNDIEEINGMDLRFLGLSSSYDDTDFGNRFIRAKKTYVVDDAIQAVHLHHPRLPVDEWYFAGEKLCNENTARGVVRCENGIDEVREKFAPSVRVPSCPQVSVIIPSCNYGRYLDGAIQSVFAQSYRNFELILVNYGSNDSTAEIIAQYENKAVTLTVPDKGVANARNQATQIAAGKYILYLDADDLLEPTFLQEVVAAANEKKIVATEAQYFEELDGMFKFSDTTPEAFEADNHILVCSLFPKSMWIELGGLDEMMPRLEDWDFWRRALKHGYVIEKLAKMLVRIRMHRDSASARYDHKYWFEYMKRKQL